MLGRPEVERAKTMFAQINRVERLPVEPCGYRIAADSQFHGVAAAVLELNSFDLSRCPIERLTIDQLKPREMRAPSIEFKRRLSVTNGKDQGDGVSARPASERNLPVVLGGFGTDQFQASSFRRRDTESLVLEPPFPGDRLGSRVEIGE